MTLVYLGVGSNLEREKHMQAAYLELARLGSVKASNVYESEPVGLASYAFFNFVVELKTSLSLTELYQRLKLIELKWGRKKESTAQFDHTLDIDILVYGQEISADRPCIPREDIFKYEFVLKPLFELNPQLEIPIYRDEKASITRLSIAQIWAAFKPKGNLKRIDISWPV